MGQFRRAVPRLKRSIRVITPGLRARVDDVDGDVVNVSATGAVLRVDRPISVGSEQPLLLEPNSRRIHLSGRIVRCEPRWSIESLGGATVRRQVYALGILFTEASAEGTRAIMQLCGGSGGIEELPYRILVMGDDAKLNALVSEMLVQIGYVTCAVKDPMTVVATARKVHADAIVINIRHEPESSAWWGIDSLGTNPVTHVTPLLVLTDTTSLKPARRRYLAERAVRVLGLPLSPEELFAALEVVLRQSP